MEHNIDVQHSGSARLSFAMTLVSILSFISKSNVAWGIGVGSGLVAMISGVMAIRYYYYATKKMKN
jgi:hypothetical protein